MADIIQRSFSGGEIAPSLWARSDQSKYATGLRTCRNFIVHKHGGVSNRPGTGFDAETKTSTKLSILVKFRFSNTQTYAMEFGDKYIRWHKNGGYLVVTDTDAPAWSAATNYVIGDLVTSGGIRYYCILGHINQVPPNVLYWYALTGSIYEIPTTYLESELADLRFTQSADVVSIVHPTHDPATLSRSGNVKWKLTDTVFGPSVSAPTGQAAVAGAAGAIVWRYKVSSIDSATGEESNATAAFSCTGATPTSAAPNVLTWVAASGATSYFVYKELIPGNGTYGLIGVATGTTFNDINITPTSGQGPQVNKTPFSSSGNKPSTVCYYQGRRVYGATNNEPEKITTSKSGLFNNMSISSPLRSDDSVSFSLSGESVNKVMALVGLRKLIILTDSVDWSAEGDASGILSPGNINPTQQSYNGAASLQPVVIGNEILYLQARGNVVRSLGYEFSSDGYKGDDVTLFSNHLFVGKTIVSWAYAQIPDSIVWVVMSDGSLLGLTYIKSQQVWGWHRHDTDGLVESVCVIPEGNRDVLYLIIKRMINGVVKRCVEYMHSRVVLNVITDSKFLDSSLTYDGTNLNLSNTITITGGVLWDDQESLTATAISVTFVPGSVGNQLVLVSGSLIQKFNIIGYSTDKIVTVRAIDNVEVGFRTVAISSWSMAVSVVSGLSHLEGKSVGALGDGNVVGNGVDLPLLVVTGGSVNLGRPYSIVNVGLPIQADIETLSIDGAQQQTISNKESIVHRVDVMVESSRGMWVGPDSSNLFEFKQRSNENYNELTKLATEIFSINIDSTYEKGGRVFIRQKDPLPLTILAVIPVGQLGES